VSAKIRNIYSIESGTQNGTKKFQVHRNKSPSNLKPIYRYLLFLHFLQFISFLPILLYKIGKNEMNCKNVREHAGKGHSVSVMGSIVVR
jgi:hypothetical protein